MYHLWWIFFLALGNFLRNKSFIPNITPLIDWLAWAPIIAAGVSAGASIGIAGNAGDFPVYVTMEIENWTKYQLSSYAASALGGYVDNYPPVVSPAKKERMRAHKVGGTATGSYGVVSWKIAGKSRRIVIMWSAPYSFDFHSNWLAVGLTRTGITGHESSWFNQMYYHGNGGGLRFTRKEFYRDSSQILFDDSDFQIVAAMGSSHKPIINVILRPKNENDLAPSLKTRLDQARRK